MRDQELNFDGIERVPLAVFTEKAYLDYSMYVILDRALPHLADGLKPVQRRIVYAMSELGLNAASKHKKSARTVGDVIGKFHPHGDSACYEAMVHMAQPFTYRYPIVDGQGNWGSTDDPKSFAAMRYTEARLTRYAEVLLGEIDAGTVDFGPNFDGTLEEPLWLPARLPNLLLNGATGIAVGMATNIPPHNLGEVSEGVQWALAHPEASREELLDALLERIKGPDFPTGAMIVGRKGIEDAYRTGRGSVMMRAKAEFEVSKKGDRQSIVIDAIPYQVNKARLIERIADLVREKTIEGISDIRDESDRDGMRIVFELKRGEQAEIVLNNLYKQTQMRTSFGVIMLSIVNGQPRELGIIDCIKRFIEHRVEVVRRRTDYLLRKARDREHILLGFKKALENLDEVIAMIRA